MEDGALMVFYDWIELFKKYSIKRSRITTKSPGVIELELPFFPKGFKEETESRKPIGVEVKYKKLPWWRQRFSECHVCIERPQ